MIKNIMKNIGTKPAGLKTELFNALKNHKKTPGYNYSDFDEKDIDNFLEVAKTDMPNASPDELKNELISRYENAAKLTAKLKEEKRNKDPKYRPEKVYEAPEEVRGDIDRPKNDYISSHNTTKNLKNNHPYADDDDIKAFYEEEIKGRGNGTEEAAKEIFSNYGNTSRYFDEWYKRNRNKKWYAETKAREK